MHFINHPCCLLYKGYFPSNQLWWWTFRVYGDHVPTSFVPSTIHWVPAKLLDGVMPHGKNRCRLQLLFLCLICYWPAFACRGTDLLSGRYTTTAYCWSFADVVRSGLHRLWVSVPEPCPVSDAFHQPLDRVLELLLLFYLLCCHWCLWSCRMFDIFQKFLRIISCPCLQNCVNPPQYLAGYHNQWLG